MLPGDAASVQDYYEHRPRHLLFLVEADTGRHGARGGRAVSAWRSFCLYLKSLGTNMSRNAGRLVPLPSMLRLQGSAANPGLREREDTNLPVHLTGLCQGHMNTCPGCVKIMAWFDFGLFR